MAMSENSVLSLGPHGFHRLAYTQWGQAENERVLVCLHGLTRQSRDFDHLAQALEDRYRIACPDLPGRGASHWLTVADDYTPVTYAADMTALIARLEVDDLDWVGTSLGGIVGMMLAAMPNTPIRRLVINDVGAFTPKSALERIAGYVGTDPLFADLDEAEAYFRRVAAPFGPLSDAQWAYLTRVSVRSDVDTGGLRPHYDPAIALPFRQSAQIDLDLWAVWDRISCPVLILRGMESDVLTHETAQEMLVRGPAAELIEFPGIGHAPVLMDAHQIDAVREWLLR